MATGDALLVPDAAAVATAAERYASYVDIHRRLAPVYHTTRPMN